MSNLTTAEQLQAISEQLATMASTDSEAIQSIDEQLGEFEQLKTDVHNAMNANYQLFPNRIKQVSLEKMYADIVAASVQAHVADENAVDLTGVAAFGIQCLMSHGEEISHSGTRMFFSNGTNNNGEAVYTELNDGVNFVSSADEGENEIVNLFFFPTTSTGSMVIPELPLNAIEVYFWYNPNNTVTFTNINDVLKNVTRVSTNYYTFANNAQITDSYFNTSSAKILNLLPNAIGGLGLKGTNGDQLGGNSTGNIVESSCEVFLNSNNAYTAGLGTPIVNKIVKLPNLKTVENNIRGFFKNNVPKEYHLDSIESFGSGASEWSCHFYNWMSVPIIIPETVKNIGKYLIGATNNQNGYNNVVIMKCKNANPIIDTNWITVAPTQVFSLCLDWGASIYLVKACTTTNGWNVDGWINFFTGKTSGVDNLRDWTLEANGGYTTATAIDNGYMRELTIPSAMLTTLQADTEGAAAIAEANRKLWRITGA